MPSDSGESRSVVDATRLPYVVPVDAVVRGFQLSLMVAAVYTFYSCAADATDTGPGGWVVVALFLAFAAYLQFHSSGLSFDEAGIRHKGWFGRARTVPWEAIQSVRTGTTRSFDLRTGKTGGTLPGAGRGAGVYAMVLERKDGQKPFLINIKPYSMKGLIVLSHFIRAKAAGADIDQATRKLAQGIVPSVFFGEQKGHG